MSEEKKSLSGDGTETDTWCTARPVKIQNILHMKTNSHNRNAVFFFPLNSSHPAESFRYLRFHTHVKQTACGSRRAF